MRIKVCCFCGAEFDPGKTNRKACSPACSLESKRAKARDHAKKRYVPRESLPERECAECGAPFTPYRNNSLYCTRRCGYRAADRMKRERHHSVGRKCVRCGVEGLPWKPGIPVCRECKADPRSNEPEREHRRRLKTYGLTQNQYDEMLAAQGGLCAICKTPEPGRKTWAIDHCHDTGVVRGLLCLACNSGIGHLRDSAELLLSAAEYISRAKVAA